MSGKHSGAQMHIKVQCKSHYLNLVLVRSIPEVERFSKCTEYGCVFKEKCIQVLDECFRE